MANRGDLGGGTQSGGTHLEHYLYSSRPELAKKLVEHELPVFRAAFAEQFWVNVTAQLDAIAKAELRDIAAASLNDTDVVHSYAKMHKIKLGHETPNHSVFEKFSSLSTEDKARLQRYLCCGDGNYSEMMSESTIFQDLKMMDVVLGTRAKPVEVGVPDKKQFQQYLHIEADKTALLEVPQEHSVQEEKPAPLRPFGTFLNAYIARADEYLQGKCSEKSLKHSAATLYDKEINVGKIEEDAINPKHKRALFMEALYSIPLSMKINNPERYAQSRAKPEELMPESARSR